MSLIHIQGTRIAAWLCVVILAVLSLIPGDTQIRSGIPGIYEHAVAYFGTAALFMLGYHKKACTIAGGLAAYGGFLEFLQHFAPGRTSNLSDAIASGSGAVLGVVFLKIVLECRSRQA